MKNASFVDRKRKFLWGLVPVALLVTGTATAHARDISENGIPTQVVVTVLDNSHAAAQNVGIQRDDVLVRQGRRHAQVVGWKRIDGATDGVQVVILLDDSLQSKVSINFDDLRKFIRDLPATTQVAVGYMVNGQAVMAGSLTTDHESVVKQLRLPTGMIGVNASPYFCISDLIRHWPAKGRPAASKTVLAITDGIDRYYEPGMYDPLDPYVNSAIADAQKSNVMVSSFYFRDRGGADQGMSGATIGQNYLQQVASATGGTMYYEGIGNPVTFAPFVKDLQKQLADQYLLTFLARGQGLQPVKVTSEVHHVKLQSQADVEVGQQILPTEE